MGIEEMFKKPTKVICRGVATGIFKGIKCVPEICSHGIPHKLNECYTGNVECDCQCIPLPFEMIMSEIIKEEEENENNT